MFSHLTGQNERDTVRLKVVRLGMVVKPDAVLRGASLYRTCFCRSRVTFLYGSMSSDQADTAGNTIATAAALSLFSPITLF